MIREAPLEVQHSTTQVSSAWKNVISVDVEDYFHAESFADVVERSRWDSYESRVEVNTRRLLVEEGGFLYDSDAYNDDLPYFVHVAGKRHLVIPYSLVYNDSRFIFAQGFSSPSDFVDQVKRAIDEYRREARAGYPKMMSIGVHGRLFGQAGRLSGLREVIEHTLGLQDVWIATREQIAQWWLDHHQEWSETGTSGAHD